MAVKNGRAVSLTATKQPCSVEGVGKYHRDPLEPQVHLVTDLPEHPKPDTRALPELPAETETPNPLEPWAHLEGIIT